VLNYSSDYQGQIQVKIVDMSGRQVLVQEFSKSAKEMNRPIDVEDLSTGAYYVIIQTDNNTITKKLIRSDK
jgi:glucose/arabinose dehydrogenase